MDTRIQGLRLAYPPDILEKLPALLVLLFLPVASALNNEVAPSPSHGSASSASASISFHGLVRVLVGCVIALIITVSGRLGGVAKILIGPLMGFTSVLSMTIRSDPAVRPEFSWV